MPPADVQIPLRAHLRRWQASHRRAQPPFLTYRREGRRLLVIDGREPGAPARVHDFDEPAALGYEFCGPTFHSATRVFRHLTTCGLRTDLATVQRDLDQFTAL